MPVFDTSVLLLVLDPNARPPIDSQTGRVVSRAPERIEFLISSLSSNRRQIIIPTPVLSEVLVHAGRALSDYLTVLNQQASFTIAPFDQKAAIEAAIAMADALKRGGHRVDAANQDASKTKIKFDRQIVAIAKAEGAQAIYSDDADVFNYGNTVGIKVIRTQDLDLPPEDPQRRMDI